MLHSLLSLLFCALNAACTNLNFGKQQTSQNCQGTDFTWPRGPCLYRDTAVVGEEESLLAKRMSNKKKTSVLATDANAEINLFHLLVRPSFCLTRDRDAPRKSLSL